MTVASASALFHLPACEAPSTSDASTSQRASAPRPAIAAPALAPLPPPVRESVSRPRLASGRGWLHLAWTQPGLDGRGDALFFSARAHEDGRWRDLSPLSRHVAPDAPVQLVSAPAREVAITWSAPIGDGQIRPWIAISHDAGRRFAAPEILDLPAGVARTASALIAPPTRADAPWTTAIPRAAVVLPGPASPTAPSSPPSYAWTSLAAPPTAEDASRLEALTVCSGGGALGLWCSPGGEPWLATLAEAHLLHDDARCLAGQRPLSCRGNLIALATESARSGETWLWIGQSPAALRRLIRLPAAAATVTQVEWIDDTHLLAAWIDRRRTLRALTIDLSGGGTRSLRLADAVLEASATLDAERSHAYFAWTAAPATPTAGGAAVASDRGTLHLGSVALRAGMLSSAAPEQTLDPRDSTR